MRRRRGERGARLRRPARPRRPRRSGGAIDPFVFHLAIFALAVFVGYYVVWSVTPALHTPLMSVTNAISSVIVVGALLSVGVAASTAARFSPAFVGFLALILASVNIFGGFHRHRAHARDVQEEGLTSRERQSRRPPLSRLRRPVHPGAARASSPATSRQGNRFGIIGMAIAVLTTLALRAPSLGLSCSWSLLGFAHRRRHRRLARPHRADDGDAATGGDVPLAGRPRRGAGGGRRAPRAAGLRHRRRRAHPSGQPHRNVARPGDRRDHLHRLDHRLRQARRPHVRRADPAAATPCASTSASASRSSF